MRPLTETIPKALLPVNGRPFADLQLEWLSAQGVSDVVFSVNYLGETIERHVGDGSRFDLRVRYVYDGARYLGTGGALRAVIDAGAVPEAFCVLNGDSYLDLDIRNVERVFTACGRPALMTVMHNRNRWDASNAIYREGRVVIYDKSRPQRWRNEMEWIDYGFVMLLRHAITDHVGPAETADLGDLLRDLSIAGQLAGLEVEHRFYEVGSPRGLADLERHLTSLSDERQAARPDHER